MRGKKLRMMGADMAVDHSIFPSSADIQTVLEDGHDTTSVDPKFVGDAPVVA